LALLFSWLKLRRDVAIVPQFYCILSTRMAIYEKQISGLDIVIIRQVLVTNYLPGRYVAFSPVMQQSTRSKGKIYPKVSVWVLTGATLAGTLMQNQDLRTALR